MDARDGRTGETCPRTGDLLIREHGPQRYTLSVVPGEPLLQRASGEALLRAARLCAQLQHVDVWFTEDGARFVRSASARRAPQRPGPARSKWAEEAASG